MEAQLPVELLAVILQHVDLRQRLSACATVNRTWHNAALAATRTITHRSRDAASTAALQAWLAAYGSHLESVQLAASYHSLDGDLQPSLWTCPRLTAVSLSHIPLNHLEHTHPLTPNSSDAADRGVPTAQQDGPPAASSSSSAAAAAGSPDQQSGTLQQPGGCGSFMAAFQHLTSLTLTYCCISRLDGLAAVTGLRHLRLERLQRPAQNRNLFYTLSLTPGYTLDAGPLASLQQLTSLHITKGRFRDLLQTACQLTKLQALRLVRCGDAEAASGGVSHSAELWQQLLGLTHLQVESVQGLLLSAGDGSSSSSSGSGSSGSSSGSAARPLQQLQRLELRLADGLDPLLLSAASGLRHLSIASTPLTGGSAGTSALLSVLNLVGRNLTYLNLCGTLKHVAAEVLPYAAAPAATLEIPAAALMAGGSGDGRSTSATAAELAAAAGYAALTASSALKQLDLSRCVLPPNAVQALLGGNYSNSSSSGGGSGGGSSSGGSSRLPKLQRLMLADSCHAVADLPLLVAACPGLHELDLTRCTTGDIPPPAGTLSALSQLQHLSSLSICSVDDAAAAQLAALTRLESLSVLWRSSLSDAGVQVLTALRRLTNLWVHGELSTRVAGGYVLSLSSRALPPSVWCQLQEACSRPGPAHLLELA